MRTLQHLLHHHFSHTYNRPRSQLLGEESHRAIQHRAVVRKAKRSCYRQLCNSVMYAYFKVWQQSSRSVRTSNVVQTFNVSKLSVDSLHQTFAYCTRCLELSDRAVKQIARREKATYVSALARRAEESAVRNDTKDLYAVTRSLSKRTHTRVPCVKAEDGTCVSDPASIARRWQQHFGRKLCGAQLRMSDLLNQAVELDTYAFQRLASSGIYSSFIPSRACVTKILRIGKKGRAFGEDGIPDEGPAEALTDLLHPLFLKMFLRLEVPIAFRGGC